MPRIVQHRRGTTAEVAGITGAAGELFVDTSKVTLVVMDGILQGGNPMASESSVAVLSSTVVSISSTLASVSSLAGTNASDIDSVSSTLASVSSLVGTNTTNIGTLSSNLASLSSTVSNISVPTGTTTTVGLVRPDNSSLNISAAGVMSLGSSITAQWTIQEVSNDLIFYYAGTAKFKLTSAGAFVAVDNVTAYGTI